MLYDVYFLIFKTDLLIIILVHHNMNVLMFFPGRYHTTVLNDCPTPTVVGHSIYQQASNYNEILIPTVSKHSLTRAHTDVPLALLQQK